MVPFLASRFLRILDPISVGCRPPILFSTGSLSLAELQHVILSMMIDSNFIIIFHFHVPNAIEDIKQLRSQSPFPKRAVFWNLSNYFRRRARNHDPPNFLCIMLLLVVPLVVLYEYYCMLVLCNRK